MGGFITMVVYQREQQFLAFIYGIIASCFAKLPRANINVLLVTIKQRNGESLSKQD